MTSDADSVELLRRHREGDEGAATELYQRYIERLNALARSRISAGLRRRMDADDVTQSVYRSFFARAADGQFHLERSGQLWSLLARMTLNKLAKKAEQHSAARRSTKREQMLDDQLHEVATREPGPDDLAAFEEQLASLYAPLSADQRQAVEMRLKNHTIEEIAEEVGRTERTVRRWLDEIKRSLHSE